MVTVRIWARLGVGLLLVATAGTAGAALPASASSVGSDGTAASAVAQPASTTGGPTSWRPCPDEPELQCRGIRVPRDWSRPKGRSYVVNARRLPARPVAGGRSEGSVIINFGGPGEDGSALSLFTDNPLRRHFDLVSWDPRGVGSDPELAECGTPAMGSWRPRTGPFTWSQIARQTFRQRATVNRACVAANKKVLPYVGSNQVVRDLDAVREAVGQRRLTYVGFSYGTRLGRLYAQMFPDRVRAMVLDGVTGPYSRVSDYLTSSRRGGTAAWRWVRNGLAPPVRSLNNRLFTSLQSRTVVVDGVESDRWGLWWNLKSVLRSSRARTSTATVTCQWGQAAGLATTGCPPESSAPTALPAAVTLVDCSDLAGRVSPRRIGNSLAGRSIAGPAAVNVIDYTTMCAGVPEPTDPVPPPQRTRLATPPLLINGIADPSTPLYSAERTHRFLPGSRLLRVDTSVHGLFLFSRSACVDAIATRYLRHRVLPPAGATCPTP